MIVISQLAYSIPIVDIFFLDVLRAVKKDFFIVYTLIARAIISSIL